MNVNITVRDFNYGYKQGTWNKFWGEMTKNKGGGEKGLNSIWEIILLSCKQLNLYCTFSQFLKSTFLTYLVF